MKITQWFLFFISSITLVSHASEKISAKLDDSMITINTCDYDAGAICSLKWKGKEFINDYDHGRQLQSAISFDNLGEDFNPTEAGSSSETDGLNPHRSSSKLLASFAEKNHLTTKTQMAFWKPVHEQKLSDYLLQKSVQIGLPGLPHTIEYLTEFTLPHGVKHSIAQFEVLTGYMPKEFSDFWTFDPSTNILKTLSDVPGEQNLPIIFSTPDQKYAMGIYSPDSPQPEYKNAGYGRWRFPDCVKWNNVFRFKNASGTYKFRSYVIVGTMADVKADMRQLEKKNYHRY